MDRSIRSTIDSLAFVVSVQMRWWWWWERGRGSGVNESSLE